MHQKVASEEGNKVMERLLFSSKVEALITYQERVLLSSKLEPLMSP
jgi:hypothetical protein